MKRFLQITSAISVLSLCFFMIAPQAFAEEDVSSTAISLDLATGSVEIYESEGVTYCVQNGDTQATTGGVIIRQNNNGTVTANTVTVSGGSCKVTISSLNIEAEDYGSPISVNEDAVLDLTLLGNSVVTGGFWCAGIQVPSNASLIIGGNGSIIATGGDSGAGIGGWRNVDGGTITINSGTVRANGVAFGAGIGGGDQGDGGNITINGGAVTAIGAPFGAGIGGGNDGNAGTVTINGGTVIADGGFYGAGIGGGNTGAGGAITIGGSAVVTAIGGFYGPGIGGWNGDGDTIITITGGTVSANGDPDKAPDIGVVGSKYGTFDAVIISGNATVTTENGDPPRVRENIFIDTQPLQSAAHLNHTPVVFVTAHGHSGLSYRWQISTDNENWADLQNETSCETGTFSMTEELDGAYLRCMLTNGWGNIQYTNTVQIYVLAFEKQPTSIDANLNDMVSFDATSTCTNITYQWQRSYDDGATWSSVPDEIYSALIVNATLSESSAKYRCVITATNGDQLASDVVSINLDLGNLVTYTVQDFMQDTDGSGYTVTSQQVLEGLSGTTVTASDVSYDGFTLNTRKSTLSGTVAEDSSLVLTHYFDRQTYSITFDTNGGNALPALEALYGAPIQAPSNPTRYGYVFDGWYADEYLTEEYIFDTMPLNGTTVYAKWVPVGAERGVEYKINGLSIRDSDTFELLDEIPESGFLVEVSVTNLEATETDTILLVYYTDAGQMIGMNYMFANTPVGYTATFGAAVDNTGSNISIIRAFVLPSLGNPIPLAENKSIGQ